MDFCIGYGILSYVCDSGYAQHADIYDLRSRQSPRRRLLDILAGHRPPSKPRRSTLDFNGEEPSLQGQPAFGFNNRITQPGYFSGGDGWALPIPTLAEIKSEPIKKLANRQVSRKKRSFLRIETWFGGVPWLPTVPVAKLRLGQRAIGSLALDHRTQKLAHRVK